MNMYLMSMIIFSSVLLIVYILSRTLHPLMLCIAWSGLMDESDKDLLRKHFLIMRVILK